jgi:hypothetical protein
MAARFAIDFSVGDREAKLCAAIVTHEGERGVRDA